MPDWFMGGLIAFGIATLTTPAGVSGAVFLVPVQVALGVPNPSLTPTNLLYNVVATPGALLRFARDAALRSPLARALVLGSIPGVVIGAVLRVEVLSGQRALLLIVAAVLLPLGVSLLRGRRARDERAVRDAARPDGWVSPLAGVIGIVGGLYGIGGGSLLSPLLVRAGFGIRAVAPAALVTTLLTSVVGIAAFQVLALIDGGGSIAPDWALGLALGAGGLLGGYLGASLSPRLPERVLRTILGCASILIATKYLIDAFAEST